MNHLEILNETRCRVMQAAYIDPAKDLKLTGQDFDTSGKSFWAEEHLIGGEAREITNHRGRISGYLIQYDLCTPPGTSMETAELKAQDIEEILHDASFRVNITLCHIRNIKISRSESKLRNAVSVLLTLDLMSKRV